MFRLGIKPVGRFIETDEKHSQRSAAKDRRQRGSAHRAGVDIAGNQRSNTDGAAHQDHLHIQTFFLEVTLFLGGIERHVRDAVDGNGESKPRRFRFGGEPDDEKAKQSLSPLA